MARLSSKIEQKTFALNEVLHCMRVTDIGDVDRHSISNVSDVLRVTAVLGNQAVDEGDLCAEIDQPARKMAADEAQTPGDQSRGTAISAVVRRYRRFQHLSIVLSPTLGACRSSSLR